MTLYDSLDEQLRSTIASYIPDRAGAMALEVIQDYWIGLVSRELSLQGRREVLTGKAKFGIFGDGKELPQLAMARAFKKGDYRAGYYRDQTLMLSLGLTNVEDFLSQMYSDVEHDPYSGGRQMTGHFATAFNAANNEWIDQTEQYNISSGVSCTGGQMGRAIGLAAASKYYRNFQGNFDFSQFSDNGNEVCFCTIGDASTSEGVFWETINAAAVTQVPLVVAVWDDGYGISVPKELQTTKGSISKILKGFQKKKKDANGINLYQVDGWDYASLCVTFDQATDLTRRLHVPSVVHVSGLTQPQGHSTSGSHERYKSKERLAWEIEHDGLTKMADWILKNKLLSEELIDTLKREARSYVREKKKESWSRFQNPNAEYRATYDSIMSSIATEVHDDPYIESLIADHKSMVNPTSSEILANAQSLHYGLRSTNREVPIALAEYIVSLQQKYHRDYGHHLYATGDQAAINISVVDPIYSDDSPMLNGFEIINAFFDKKMESDPRIIAFGEDVGHIGDVNQGMSGLQKKYGVDRVFDTGIREWTILGQGQGAAMRGLRPIAEIQYLDYLVYALPLLTDDIATLRYRSNNLQQVPLLVRTRGHRLEGIWHTGSPMGMMIHSLRGMYILTPRNMVQAAGMYNTMLQSADPAILVECLNGYRLKEKLPDNMGEYTVPLGMPEVLQSGSDVTVVTYGSCVQIANQAIEILERFSIDVELIDVQTLVPFDLEQVILQSLKKTNKILFLDEDVPGGATAYMMQQVIETHGGFNYLDGPPKTVTAKDHRTPYGSEGDYYSKPQVSDVVEAVYHLVFEEEYH